MLVSMPVPAQTFFSSVQAESEAAVAPTKLDSLEHKSYLIPDSERVAKVLRVLWKSSPRLCMIEPAAVDEATRGRTLCMQILAAGDGVKGKAGQHRLELRGLIPPWIVNRLLEVLKDSHHARFQVKLSYAAP